MSWLVYGAAAVAFVLWLAYNPIGWLRLYGVPSPPRKPFLGHMLSIQKMTLHNFHFQTFRQCGPIFTIWWGRRPYVVICDPPSCRKVLQRFNHRTLVPAPFREGPDLEFNNEGLVFAKDVEHHKYLLTAWMPHFTPASLLAYHPLMLDAVRRLVAHLSPAAQSKKPVDMHHKICCLTMEVVGRAAFGIDINAYIDPADPSTSGNVGGGDGSHTLGREVVDAMSAVMNGARPNNASLWGALYMILPEALGQTVAAMAKALPDKPWRQLLAAQDSLRRVALRLIRANSGGRRKRSDEASRKAAAAQLDSGVVDAGSFLKHLITTRNKTSGVPMTETCMVGNMMSFILTGHDIVANTLAFAFYHIATHPEVEAKLLKEIDAFGPGGILPGLEELTTYFPYVAAVVDETMRLTPSASFVLREASEPILLHGHVIPAGTTFQVSLYSCFHDPDVWRDAMKFVPERFLPVKSQWSAPPGAFMPFGDGLRHCMGANFALQEMRLAVVAVLQQFTMRLAPGYPALVLETGILTGPRDPIMVTVHARHV